MRSVVMRLRHGYHRCRLLVLALTLTVACSPTRGCVESQFELATESRLPRWFQLPPGRSRQDVRVEMRYYTGLTELTVSFTMRGTDGSLIAERDGRRRDTQPLTIPPTQNGPLNYPNYAVVTVDGSTEIIEHRTRDNMFFVSDDPAVRAALLRE